jgi:hypothetical protein
VRRCVEHDPETLNTTLRLGGAPVPKRLKALIIAYYFPPDGAIGGVRPYQFARHFPEFGVEPWVLTVEPQHAEQPDAAFLPNGVPERHLLRTPVDTTFRDRVLQLWRRSRNGDAAPASPPTGSPAARRFQQAREWVLSWLAYTDPLIGWYRPALERAEEALRRVRFDVLVSTSPPRVTALVARELSRRYRVPWVMDVRDPWQQKNWEAAGASSIVAYHNDRLFSKCVDTAQIIVHNTERLRQDTCALKPDAADKTYCVPNGFEHEWTLGSDSRARVFNVAYYGNIMGRRSCTAFLDGLRHWLDARGKRAPPRIAVRFVGTGFESTAEEIAARDLERVVSVHPPVPRTQVRQLINDDYVLLSFANEQPLQVPGKTYDYLATGRRILAVTEHDGATADVLGPVEGCTVAEKPHEVASALETFYRDFEHGASPRVERSALLADANYEHRAEQFAGLLHSIVGEQTASA